VLGVISIRYVAEGGCDFIKCWVCLLTQLLSIKKIRLKYLDSLIEFYFENKKLRSYNSGVS
jgi:hypothetical protein